MSWENYDDVLGQLQNAGLLIDAIEINTHKPKRCRVEGLDKESRGWYWLTDHDFTDKDGSRRTFIVGSFGVYQGNDNGKQKVELDLKGSGVTMSSAERTAINERHKENARRAKAERDAESRRAAAKAGRAWSTYLPTGSSDYLERKGVQAHGVRFSPAGNGTFAVPMMDTAGSVHGLQVIRGKNRGKKLEKQYWPKGLSKVGHFHLMGMVSGVVLVGEGYATCATAHEATGLPVAVAFDANNLMPVAQQLRKAYPRARILLLADDDYMQKCRECGETTAVNIPACSHCGEPHRQENPGIKAASTAALAVSGAWVAPVFPEERSGAKLTDFNDLYLFPCGGLASVRVQLEEAISKAGWGNAVSTPPAGNPTQGEGESRRRAVSVMPLADAVERFVPLDDGTGKYLFDLWTKKIAHKDQMAAVLNAGVRWDDVKRHPTWISRGAYYLDQVGFDPTEKDDGVLLNTWQGWPLKPKRGECQNILDLLLYLCSGEQNGDEVYHWLLRWMAYPLQNPGAKMSSAVIMHGPQGTGKSAVFQTLAKIYGDYSTVLNQRGLEDKFNSDWADSKLFILAEEVVTRAEMWHIKNELKELVTGDWIRVNPKNVAAYRQRNQVNIVYLSNEGQPLPIENDDRRHLVVWTPQMLGEEFYDEVWLEIENGGVEALYHYLLNLDISGFHPKKRPPMTSAKQALIQLSKPSEDRFIQELLDGDLTWPIRPCANQHIYTAYLRWCRENGVRNPRESNQFIGHVNRLPGWTAGPMHIYESYHYTGSTRRQRMVIPPPEALTAAGTAIKEGQTKSQWLTDAYLEWHNKLEESA
jgi:putative DNA primase/helicase